VTPLKNWSPPNSQRHDAQQGKVGKDSEKYLGTSPLRDSTQRKTLGCRESKCGKERKRRVCACERG